MRKITWFSAYLILLIGSAITASAEVDSKYPPYPDIWGYDAGPGGIYSLCAAKNGEFYILPRISFLNKPHTNLRGLFSGKSFELTSEQAERLVRNDEAIKIVGPLNCRRSYKYSGSVKIPNGSIIKRCCIGGSCQNPIGIGAELINKNGQIEQRKVFLYLLEKPKPIRVQRPAAEGGSFFVSGRVQALDPHFILLRDGTFLFYNNVVVRFDPTLKTKYPVNKDHFFMLDAIILENIYQKANQTYGADERLWNQFVQDQLAVYLEKLK